MPGVLGTHPAVTLIMDGDIREGTFTGRLYSGEEFLKNIGHRLNWHLGWKKPGPKREHSREQENATLWTTGEGRR